MSDLPSSIRESLKQVKLAGRLSEELTEDFERSSFWPSIEQLERVQNTMQAPNWKMQADHTVTTINEDNGVMELQVRMDFELDLDSLQDAGERLSKKTAESLRSTLKDSLESQHEELDDIVLSTLMPRSFGVSRKIRIDAYIDERSRDSLEKGKHDKAGVVELTTDNEMVVLDYASVMQGLLLHIAEVDFEEWRMHMRVPQASFEESTSFSKNFRWDDANLVYDIQTYFEPLINT